RARPHRVAAGSDVARETHPAASDGTNDAAARRRRTQMQSCRALFVVSLLSGCAGAQPPEAELAPPADPSAEHVIPQTLGPGPLARVTVRLPRTYEERIAGREVTVLEALFVIDNTS